MRQVSIFFLLLTLPGRVTAVEARGPVAALTFRTEVVGVQSLSITTAQLELDDTHLVTVDGRTTDLSGTPTSVSERFVVIGTGEPTMTLFVVDVGTVRAAAPTGVLALAYPEHLEVPDKEELLALSRQRRGSRQLAKSVRSGGKTK